MRKLLSLLIVLCMHIAARGQTIVSLEDVDLSGLPQSTSTKGLRYWFDNDAGSLQVVSQQQGQMTIDASRLTDGLHTLHYQIIDDTDAVAIVSSVLFLKTDSMAEVTSATQLRYWLDDDASSVKTVNGTNDTYILDVSMLTEGLHTLHYQTVDSHDALSIPRSSVFLKLGTLSSPIPAKQLRYWFDDDSQSVRIVATSNGVHTIDAQQLVGGLHTLHYQVVGADDAVYDMASDLFLKLEEKSDEGNITPRMLMYWFDDETTVSSINMSQGVQMLDASMLVDGLHTIHYQVLCSNGQMTSAMSSVFLQMSNYAETATAKLLRYWFDDQQSATETDIADGAQLLDATMLEDGLHTIHYQIVDNVGVLTSPVSAVFLKIPGSEEVAKAKNLRYWFDDGVTVAEIPITSGTQMIDVAGLHDGLHTVHYQAVDEHGAVSNPVSSVFLKMDNPAATAESKSLRYWFDDDITSVKVVDVSRGTQAIDVTDLVSGLHTLNYQLIDANDKVSTPVAHIFMRDFDKLVADGQNGITRYQYWLNDHSAAMETVTLSTPTTPFQLTALLPVQKEPIRSQQFHFEVTDGQAAIYAKNTFNVRFHDAARYFADADKAFVDYSVKQEIDDAMLLESGIRQTTNKPTGNEIKWYMLDAEPGDSVQFQLDRTATVQLFAPSGEEILNVSGAESVNWFGKHVRESGTFYLALHDVTATYGNTVSLDYNHIDKYAVLRQDVAVVGNGGCSTITFEGNGFRDLYAVDLYNEQGDTIHHVLIGHESDAATSVIFNFTDATLGCYHAKFHFTDEDKVFDGLITVDESQNIDLATVVSFSSSYLRANGMTSYQVRVKNSGNMTAYRVPIYVYAGCSEKNGIRKINLPGLNIPKLFDNIEHDSLTAEDITWMKEIEATVGDTHYFIKSSLWDESINDSVYVWSAYFFADIAPNSEKTFTVEVSTSDIVNVWVTVPKDYLPLTGMVRPDYAESRSTKKRISREELCCMRSKIECIASIAADVTGIASKIAEIVGPGTTWDVFLGAASCLADGISQTISATGEIICGDMGTVQDELGDKIKAAMNGISITNSITGCLSKLVKGRWKTFLEAINKLTEGEGWMSALGISIDYMGCEEAFTQPIPGCPPNPGGGGGPSSPVNSFDPNAIYGYTSESTSKAVRDNMTALYYRIEFENDTTFATAAAHNIHLADTLDATKFDLSTFAPTRIKIGEKSAELTGEKNFVTTVDMRPEINAIAQVEGTYDEKKGIACWHISSLDPMTMEPTTYVMDGVLPVNTNGQGIGEVSYNISLKSDLAHGMEISNRAGIVFDSNDVIMTPTWTNIIDRVAPKSHVSDVKMLNDSTASVSIEASDELSGPWRYDVYVQYGSGAWFLGAQNVPADTTASVKVYEGISHGFYVVVTDSAGNVEQKSAEREYTFEVFGSQTDTHTQIELAEGWNWISHNQQEPLAVAALKPAGARMVGQTEELYNDTRFGWMGDLEELLPTQMYKLQMDGRLTVSLSGRLFNAAFRAVPLYEGWNWMGYPVANTMTPVEALVRLEAEEGDMLIGQDGLATYSGGQWQGTLLTMNPGQGYMYYSQSDKNLFLNATAQSSSRRVQCGQLRVNSGELPDGWTVNRRKYPNVMGVIARLWNGVAQEDAGEWVLAAFCGEECRGIGQTVSGTLMMNVYGQGGEQIGFRVMNIATGEVLGVSNQEAFRPEVLGTMAQPYQLTIGEPSGVQQLTGGTRATAVYDLMGRRLQPTAPLGKGIYVVTDSENKTTQKVIRR